MRGDRREVYGIYGRPGGDELPGLELTPVLLPMKVLLMTCVLEANPSISPVGLRLPVLFP